MTLVTLLLAGGFGSIIGSFLNVVIHRVPQRLSLVRPRSSCPECGHAVRAIDNVPIVSWLLLRGRCRDCAAPISPRYLLVELATGVAFALVAWRFLAGPGVSAANVLETVAFLVLAATTLALTAIDLETRTLPNRIVLPTLVAMIVLLGAVAVLRGDAEGFVRALAGGAMLFVFYLVLALVSRGGMGFGDVKLAAVLGFATAWIGWPAFAVGALAAFVLGGLAGILLLALGAAGRRSAIPFGPWMIAAAWIGVAFGDVLATAYLDLSGLGTMIDLTPDREGLR